MSSLKINNRTITFTPPQPLSVLLEQAGLAHPHPCGGRGVCGNCGVNIEGEVAPLTAAEIKAGTRLSCQTVVLGDAILHTEPSGNIQIEGADSNGTPVDTDRPLLAAIDIGTTTVVVQLLEEQSGAPMGTAAALNPQSSVASDVMGRIEAALQPDGRKKLQEQITRTLRDLLIQAAGDLSRLRRMVITGNTAMLYLLTGRDPRSLSGAPFAADCLFDGFGELFGIPVYYPPCISAFVGADITCALLAADVCASGEPAVLCDIGTNGELALWTGSELLVTSTAAGPAFEGAGIRCGMMGQSGAIDRVWWKEGSFRYHTIDDVAPRGICGSGLIDAIAAALEAEYIDESGYLEQDPLPLCDTVSLTGQDIRSVQLAKAAIAAGISALLCRAGLKEEQITRCVIAGGFGKHLSAHSVCAIGLLPKQWEERLQPVGNAALAGARILLSDTAQTDKARALAQQAKHIPLGGDATFNELYIEHMIFEQE